MAGNLLMAMWSHLLAKLDINHTESVPAYYVVILAIMIAIEVKWKCYRKSLWELCSHSVSRIWMRAHNPFKSQSSGTHRGSLRRSGSPTKRKRCGAHFTEATTTTAALWKRLSLEHFSDKLADKWNDSSSCRLQPSRLHCFFFKVNLSIYLLDEWNHGKSQTEKVNIRMKIRWIQIDER